MQVPIYRSDPKSPVHKRAAVVSADGVVHPRNYGKDLRSEDVGISMFVNLAQVGGPLTPVQRDSARAAFDLMHQEGLALLGIEPDELQKGDVVKVYKDNDDSDEVYYGIVIRSTDDLIRIKYIQPNGLMRARSFLYANGWEVEEFLGQRGWKALVYVYLDWEGPSNELLQRVINRDEGLGRELYAHYQWNNARQNDIALILGDEELILDRVLETHDRDHGCLLLSALTGERLIQALAHAEPSVVKTADVLKEFDEDQLRQALAKCLEDNRSDNAAIFRELLGEDEEDEE